MDDFDDDIKTQPDARTLDLVLAARLAGSRKRCELCAGVGHTKSKCNLAPKKVWVFE